MILFHVKILPNSGYVRLAIKTIHTDMVDLATSLFQQVGLGTFVD